MNISRITHSSKIEYVYKNGNKVISKEILNRIKKMVIPPKWIDVKISESPTDYLQVTGKDSKGRTQYIYHPLWKELTKTEKYNRLENFIKKLPVLRSHVGKILSGKIDLDNKEFLIALIIRILDKTSSRIGNEVHCDENNTYGLTTILKKHIKISGNKIKINYVGKKNVLQEFEFDDSLCSKILLKLLQLPGDRLFKTNFDENIHSLDINNFLKKIMNGNYTSKDFRTYASNVILLKLLYKLDIPVSENDAKRKLNKCCNEVAEIIGHTSQVSRTNYIYPIIINKYTENPELFLKKRASISSILKDT